MNTYLYENNCLPCGQIEPNCLACELTVSTNFTCLGCANRFYLQNNACLVCPGNCLSCTGANSCSQCEVSYYINENGTCSYCDLADCIECKSADKCINCAVGTYLAAKTSTCEPCMNGCEQCSGRDTCLYCSLGYVNYMSRCYPCKPECLSCANSPNSCQSCISGYYLSAGKNSVCIRCPDFCPICNSPNDCQQCAPGYFLNFDRMCE